MHLEVRYRHLAGQKERDRPSEKSKQDDLIDYFKLTPVQWEAWNKEHYGDNRPKWRPPLKILIVCDRLLTGFDAPIEQVMYLDKPLRDHNLLQAIARTNRPLPPIRMGVADLALPPTPLGRNASIQSSASRWKGVARSWPF